MTIKVMVLAGGFGKRLAPLSTIEKPKQFQDLIRSGQTMFQQTIARAVEITEVSNIYPVVNLQHKHLVEEQLQAYPQIMTQVIYEQVARNTAPAIALGLQEIKTGIVIVMPADHVINGEFANAIKQAVKLAEVGKIVVFGIPPTAPNAHYGYILPDSFHEKPQEKHAKNLIEKGALWNSGIFVFRAEVVVAEYTRNFAGEIPAISFDKAIMEKTKLMGMVKADWQWADIGSFSALDKFHKAD